MNLLPGCISDRIFREFRAGVPREFEYAEELYACSSIADKRPLLAKQGKEACDRPAYAQHASRLSNNPRHDVRIPRVGAPCPTVIAVT